MTVSRRHFVQRSLALSSGLAALGLSWSKSTASERSQYLFIRNPPERGYFQPLDTVKVEALEPGTLKVLDGIGHEYLSHEYRHTHNQDILDFKAGGALGHQHILFLNNDGQLLDVQTFLVDGQTEIQDSAGIYGQFLNTLYWSISTSLSQTRLVRIDDRFYPLFSRWLRDHVHTLKGLKYFYADLKSTIDLYADFQREDGMIWDNITPRHPEKNWWDKRFRYDNFIQQVGDGHYELKRIPVENDVEYLFIEGLYYTWKATGDDHWMAGLLDNALKAVDYSRTSPYRWSEKYQLLKRGFTIDTWDFQSHDDAQRSDGDIMVVYLDKTEFGIMFGDNTGMAIACRYLAEMLHHVGRLEEAQAIRTWGQALKQRIDQLAWNGQFYTHHIPENAQVERDLGDTDQAQQLSLSNAYSLNRDLIQAQCRSIINTYQAIRPEMPQTSPGEWYTIYPPFEKGFGKKWDYMNGGVTPIVAGELARGAFENGFESYGVDILNRVEAIAKQDGDVLNAVYKGKRSEAPRRNFYPISLDRIANTQYPPQAATSQGEPFGQISHGQTAQFHGIPFNISPPAPQKHRALVLSSQPDGLASYHVPLDGNPQSIYILHTFINGRSTLYGMVILDYTDGTMHTDYIDGTKNKHWWSHNNLDDEIHPHCKLAWRSDNDHYDALYLYGINNPHPDKQLKSLRLEVAKVASSWIIAGITTSDAPIYLPESHLSRGIPHYWAAAAMVYALVEGLAGVQDMGVAFKRTRLCPRWLVSDSHAAATTIRYEASLGYVSYHYHYHAGQTLTLTWTGSASETALDILLPTNAQVKSVYLDKRRYAAYEIHRVGESYYLSLAVNHLGVHQLEIRL